jgi:hypothetical protein
MVDENVALNFALKYVIRKPVQVAGGAITGFITGLTPGFIIMSINEQIGTDGNRPLGDKLPNYLMIGGMIIGTLGGAGLGLYI